MHARFCFALQEWSLCFSQLCGSSIIKSHWSLDSLWIPGPFAESPGWEAWHEAPNLHNSERISLVLFSRLWVTHTTDMEFDFIMFVPLLPSCWRFFFVSGCGTSLFFLVGSSVLLSKVVRELVVSLVLLKEEMNECPSIYHLELEASHSLFLSFLFHLFLTVPRHLILYSKN